MADKILKTRISLKYDTLENWQKSTLGLNKGEIAIAEIPTADPANKQLPPVMFKVGVDGIKTFNELNWASALAADVYGWAKAATRPAYKYGDTDLTGFGTAAAKNVGDFDAAGAATTAETNAKAYTDQKIAALPAQAEYTLESNEDGKLSLMKNGEVASTVEIEGWAELLAQANKGVTDAAAAQKAAEAAQAAAEAAQTTANSKYLKPTAGIPKADLANDVQTSLGKADTALQFHQTITTGTANGTIAVAGKDVAVAGLKALAYKESLTKSDVGLGSVENKALDTSVTTSGNYITSGGVKSYVDSAINAVKQFQYEVVDALPTASADTMGKIYLVKDQHGAQDNYDEFITIESGDTTKTYAWEKIGNTDIDLSGYVPTSRKINGKALTTDINLSASDVGADAAGAAAAAESNANAYTDGKIAALPAQAEYTLATGTNDGSLVLKKDGSAVGTDAVVKGWDVLTTSVNDKYVKPEDGIPKSDLATGVQTSLGKADSSVQSVVLAGGANNGTLKLTVNGTATDNIAVKGLADAAYKGVDATVSATSENLPTSKAVASYVGTEISKIDIPTVNNAALKDRAGNTIFTANASEDVTITIIDCGSASEVV